jgi:hypothetical protein
MEVTAMRSMLRTVVASALMAGIALSPALSADQKKVIEGCYVPIRGFAETASYSELAQLGQYRLVLIRKDSHDRKGADRALRRVVIKGPLRGVITNSEPLVLEHVIGTEERDGFIYTAEDTFETQEVVPCEGGGGVILEGEETIRPFGGTGRFAGLRPGGSLVVIGTVNTCTGLNDFEVVPGEGEICFGAPKD